jgi:hypothetical protein
MLIQSYIAFINFSNSSPLKSFENVQHSQLSLIRARHANKTDSLTKNMFIISTITRENSPVPLLDVSLFSLHAIAKSSIGLIARVSYNKFVFDPCKTEATGKHCD